MHHLLSVFGGAQVRSFVEYLYDTLPRELRDIIWNLLLDNTWSSQDWSTIVQQLNSCDNISDDEILKRDTTAVPWLAQTGFMGDGARQEIIKTLIKRHFQYHHAWGIYELYDLATKDPYQVGLTRMEVLRHLDLIWIMRPRDGDIPMCDPQVSSGIPSQYSLKIQLPWETLPSWKLCFEALLRVKHKDRFMLNATVNSDHLGLDQLVRLLETFKPVYEHLVAAGSQAKIRYLFCDRFRLLDDQPLLELDLLEFFSTDHDTWRRSVRGYALFKWAVTPKNPYSWLTWGGV